MFNQLSGQLPPSRQRPVHGESERHKESGDVRTFRKGSSMEESHEAPRPNEQIHARGQLEIAKPLDDASAMVPRLDVSRLYTEASIRQNQSAREGTRVQHRQDRELPLSARVPMSSPMRRQHFPRETVGLKTARSMDGNNAHTWGLSGPQHVHVGLGSSASPNSQPSDPTTLLPNLAERGSSSINSPVQGASMLSNRKPLGP